RDFHVTGVQTCALPISGTTVGTGQDLVGIPAETYNVLVTDINGCTKTLIQEITQPPLPISVVETVTDVKCFGENTGVIELAVTRSEERRVGKECRASTM